MPDAGAKVSAHSSTFSHNFLRTLAQMTAILIASGCGDSTSPPVAAKYLVTASELTPIAGNQVVLKAQLVDADDSPIAMPGRSVIWIDAGTSIGGFNPVSSLTLSDGSATTTFTTSTVAGRVHSISVTDAFGIKGSADLTTSTGPPARYVVGLTTTQPAVGSDAVIAAQLADVNGNPTKIGGRVVTWSSTGAGGTLSSPTSTTNSDGIAIVTFTVGTIVGAAYTVTAIDDNLAEGVSAVFIANAGPLAKYILSASVIDPPAGADILIYAQASDARDNATLAGGRLVTWTKTGSGGSFALPATETNPNTGIATVAFTTSSVAGTTYAISGSDAGGFTGTSPNITTQPQVSLASIATGLGVASTCGIASDGKAWCWGANSSGGLGNGTTIDRSLPGKVSGDLTMISLSTGASHACGVTTSGVVQCWGDNSNGKLGDNTLISRAVPAPIASSLTFTSVTAGVLHSCAVATGGDVYCWGLPGNLGDGNQASTGRNPVKVVGGHSFASISAGSFHTCGLTTTGDAYCWGSAPVAVAGGFKFTAVSSGESHSCGIRVGGAAYCWGTAGQNPAPVTGGLLFVSISAGGFHTCGITTNSSAWCWGDNTTGQLGNPTTFGTSSPTAVAGGLLFKSIGAGGGIVGTDDYYGSPIRAGHTCGVTTAGVLYCWGSNTRGELGSGPLPVQSNAPVKVGGQP